MLMDVAPPHLTTAEIVALFNDARRRIPGLLLLIYDCGSYDWMLDGDTPEIILNGALAPNEAADALRDAIGELELRIANASPHLLKLIPGVTDELAERRHHHYRQTS